MKNAKVHSGRQPVVAHKITEFKTPRANKANASFNAAARRVGSAARKITPQQAAALQQQGSKTY